MIVEKFFGKGDEKTGKIICKLSVDKKARLMKQMHL